MNEEKFWQDKITKEIKTEFDIRDVGDLKKIALMRESLAQKIKEKIINNPDLRKAFIPSNKLDEFNNAKESEKPGLIDDYIQWDGMQNIILHKETIIKALQSLPTQDKIRDYFSLYLYGKRFRTLYLEYFNNTEKKPEFNKINLFFDSNWWLYYFHIDNREYYLGRAVLSIKNDENVRILNVPSDLGTNYHGSMHLEHNKEHVYFDLFSEPAEEKHLRIIAFIGSSGKIPPLALGVYTNIYSTNSMVAGSVMLQRVEDTENGLLEARRFKFEEAEQAGVDRRIVEYFSQREKNFIKTASRILTLEMLGEWLKWKKR